MAVVLGECGAWAELRAEVARRCGVVVESPEELAVVVGRLRMELPEAERAAELRVREEFEERLREILDVRVLLERRLEQECAACEEECAELEEEAAALRRLPWLRRLAKGPRRLALRGKQGQLSRELNRTKAALKARTEEGIEEEARLHRELPGAIAGAVAVLGERLQEAERLAGSGEMAGARAELEVVRYLRELPDAFTVLNNVGLRNWEWIKCDGEYLQSAQLDHLVVGPTGVFVIETKYWSRKFLESGEGFDPVRQVRRASYLCYKLLETEGCSVKVRSLLAIRGAAPEIPPGSYVTALPVPQLSRYIRGRREMLTPEKVAEIVACLRRLDTHREAEGDLAASHNADRLMAEGAMKAKASAAECGAGEGGAASGVCSGL